MSKKKILYIIIFVVGLFSIYFIYNKVPDKEMVLDEVKLKEETENKSSSFALMLEKADGSGYEQSTSSTWPTGMVFNSELSGCIDATGNIIENVLSYNANTNSVKVRVTGATYCYIYFDNKKPSVKLTVSTDGVSNTLPTYNHYKQTLTCDDGTNSYFNVKYQRLEISNVGNTNTKCNLNYTKDTNTYTLLKDKVESVTTNYGDATTTIDNSTFTANATLSSSDYTITNMETTSDSNDAFVWDDTAKTWTSQNHTASTTSNGGVGMSFTVPDGYYQLCYTMGSEKNYDYGTIYIDGTEKFNTKGKSATEYCEYIGQITSSNVIRVAYRKDSSGDTSPDNIVFYLQSGTYNEDITTVSKPIGYRYNGKQPDNWVWFNNELWRIIGSVPTTLSDKTAENRVKIIRNESIGGIAYDAKSSGYTGAWGSNTLYTLLNSYYLGKGNGTGTSYCYGSYNSSYKPVPNCNYGKIGISSDSNDYYGRMVESVYWNTGASAYDATAPAAYTTETATQTVSGKIGLMSASDYGYAGTDYTNSMYSSTFANNTKTNWLYGQSYEWTSIQYSGSSNRALRVDSYGYVVYYYASYAYAVRPVLYLDSSVYIISGDGTESSPYILGM